MAVRTVSIAVTGTSAQLQQALRDAGLAADETSTQMSTGFDEATTKMATSGGKLSSAFESILGPGNPISKGIDAISAKFSSASTSGQSFMQKVSTAGGLAAASIAAGAIAVGAASIDMANKFDDAQSQVSTAVKDIGGNFDKLQPSILAAEKGVANLGFNSTDAAGALQTLVTASGNTKTAEQDLSIAADVARAKHESLGAAAQALAKTYAGSTKILTQFGINLDVGSGKLKAIDTDTKSVTASQDALKAVQEKVALGGLKGVAAYAAVEKAQTAVSTATTKLHKDQSAIGDVLDAVKKRTEGAAAAYGQTLSGQLAIAKAKVHDLFTSFGTELIPILDKAIGVVTKIVDWFSKHKAIAEALALVIGGALTVAIATWAATMAIAFGSSVIGSIKAAAAAFGILTGAEEEADAAADANPIGAIIAALALLGVAIYEIVDHWSTLWNGIKAGAEAVWQFLENDLIHPIENAFAEVVSFIENHWQLIVTILTGPFGAIISAFITFHSQIIGFFTAIPGEITAALSTVFNVVTTPFTQIAGWVNANVIEPTVGFFTGLPGRVVAGMKWEVSAIFGGITGAATWLQSNVITPIVNAFTAVPGLIGNAITGAIGALGNVGKALVNDIIGGINTIIDFYNNHRPSLLGVSLLPSLPDIPKLAKGTSNFAGGVAIVGERGPEMVFLPQHSQVVPNNQTPVALGGTGVGGGPSQHIEVNVASGADPHEIASEVGWAVRFPKAG